MRDGCAAPVTILFRGRVFRPSFLGFVLALAACLLAVALGNWQMRRAEGKLQAGAQREAAMHAPPLPLRADVDPRQYLGTKVRARGRFDAGQTYFLDNRLRDGRPGYEVLTPLRLGDGRWSVPVLRGWIPVGVRDSAPSVRTPEGEVVIEGLALGRLSHALEPPGYVAQGRVRQNMTLEEFAGATGLRTLPIVIEQHSETRDGLQRNWPRPDLGADKHSAYALQWYALASLAVVLFFVLSFSRRQDDRV